MLKMPSTTVNDQTLQDDDGVTLADTNSNKFVDTLTCTYAISVIAACNAELVTYPLDLTKTRLQIQGEIANTKMATMASTKLQHRGMLATAIGIVREEGPTQLWRGLNTVLCRHVIYSGVRTTFYDYLRQHYGDHDNHHHHNPNHNHNRNNSNTQLPLWKAALFGALAGSLAQWLATPIDLVKIQIQMEGKRRLMGEPPRIQNMSQAFVNIYKRGGIIGLWSGSIPSIHRAALVTLGDISGYDMSKHAILNHFNIDDGPIVHIIGSICAALMSTVLSTPADVIKSRIMNQPRDECGRGVLYKGSYDCLKQTIQNEGYLALYKGCLPTFIRCGPWSMVFWLTFEKERALMGAHGF